MSQEFSRGVLKVAVAQIIQQLGWDIVHSSALEILTDVLTRYLTELCRKTHDYSELYGRVEPNLDDLGLAFVDFDVSIDELWDFIRSVEPGPLCTEVPRFPALILESDVFQTTSQQTTNVDVSEITEINEENERTTEMEDGQKTNNNLSLMTISGSSEKKSFPTGSSETNGPLPKRQRLLPEEALHSQYEMKSCTMTESGMFCPLGVGRLPDARCSSPTTPTKILHPSSSYSLFSNVIEDDDYDDLKRMRSKEESFGIPPFMGTPFFPPALKSKSKSKKLMKEGFMKKMKIGEKSLKSTHKIAAHHLGLSGVKKVSKKSLKEGFTESMKLMKKKKSFQDFSVESSDNKVGLDEIFHDDLIGMEEEKVVGDVELHKSRISSYEDSIDAVIKKSSIETIDVAFDYISSSPLSQQIIKFNPDLNANSNGSLRDFDPLDIVGDQSRLLNEKKVRAAERAARILTTIDEVIAQSSSSIRRSTSSIDDDLRLSPEPEEINYEESRPKQSAVEDLFDVTSVPSPVLLLPSKMAPPPPLLNEEHDNLFTFDATPSSGVLPKSKYKKTKLHKMEMMTNAERLNYDEKDFDFVSSHDNRFKPIISSPIWPKVQLDPLSYEFPIIKTTPLTIPPPPSPSPPLSISMPLITPAVAMQPPLKRIKIIGSKGVTSEFVIQNPEAGKPIISTAMTSSPLQMMTSDVKDEVKDKKKSKKNKDHERSHSSKEKTKKQHEKLRKKDVSIIDVFDDSRKSSSHYSLLEEKSRREQEKLEEKKRKEQEKEEKKREQEKLEEKIRKEQERLEEKARKEQEKEERRKEQERLEEKMRKDEEKAKREQEKLEEKRREQEKLEEKIRKEQEKLEERSRREQEKLEEKVRKDHEKYGRMPPTQDKSRRDKRSFMDAIGEKYETKKKDHEDKHRREFEDKHSKHKGYHERYEEEKKNLFHFSSTHDVRSTATTGRKEDECLKSHEERTEKQKNKEHKKKEHKRSEGGRKEEKKERERSEHKKRKMEKKREKEARKEEMGIDLSQIQTTPAVPKLTLKLFGTSSGTPSVTNTSVPSTSQSTGSTTVALNPPIKLRFKTGFSNSPSSIIANPAIRIPPSSSVSRSPSPPPSHSMTAPPRQVHSPLEFSSSPDSMSIPSPGGSSDYSMKAWGGKGVGVANRTPTPPSLSINAPVFSASTHRSRIPSRSSTSSPSSLDRSLSPPTLYKSPDIDGQPLLFPIQSKKSSSAMKDLKTPKVSPRASSSTRSSTATPKASVGGSKGPTAKAPPSKIFPVSTPLLPLTKPTTSKGKKVVVTETVSKLIGPDGKMVWICPACKMQDDGSPMIGCDECDDWFHWTCLGIEEEPEEEEWFCERCRDANKRTTKERKRSISGKGKSKKK